MDLLENSGLNENVEQSLTPGTMSNADSVNGFSLDLRTLRVHEEDEFNDDEAGTSDEDDSDMPPDFGAEQGQGPCGRHLDISEESFEKDQRKMTYLTGLPTFAVLMLMFQLVSDFLVVRKTLTKFQQFVLTLMRIRLGIEFKFLSYIFVVSEPIVARNFYSVLHVMYIRYQFLVAWPNREDLFKSMPFSFKETLGDRMAVIVDCFEVFMERPSSPLEAAQLFSNYKHGRTVKFLVGMCPQGTIVFISRGFGGRASDKCIITNCGLLEKLRPHDIIMADRGFTVHELVREQGAELYMPPLKERNVDQISPKLVEMGRKISNKRIHIERVISSLRQRSKILSMKLPIEFFHGNVDGPPVIDQIAFVCCVLVNVNATIVPWD